MAAGRCPVSPWVSLSGLQRAKSAVCSAPQKKAHLVAGAADEQHIFDVNVRLQYSNDSRVLLGALEVSHSPQQGLLRHPFAGCGLTQGCVQELATAVAVDVPAEALLQRQSLMENVVLLLKPAALDSPLPAAALRLLHVVVAKLKAAVELAHNPGLQLPKGAQSEDSLAPVLCSRPAGLLAYLPCPQMQACITTACCVLPAALVTVVGQRPARQEAVARSYPGPRRVAQDPRSTLPGVAVMLRDEEAEELDLTAAAHQIAVHVLGLVQNARWEWFCSSKEPGGKAVSLCPHKGCVQPEKERTCAQALPWACAGTRRPWSC